MVPLAKCPSCGALLPIGRACCPHCYCRTPLWRRWVWTLSAVVGIGGASCGSQTVVLYGPAYLPDSGQYPDAGGDGGSNPTHAG